MSEESLKKWCDEDLREREVHRQLTWEPITYTRDPLRPVVALAPPELGRELEAHYKRDFIDPTGMGLRNFEGVSECDKFLHQDVDDSKLSLRDHLVSGNWKFVWDSTQEYFSGPVSEEWGDRSSDQVLNWLTFGLLASLRRVAWFRYSQLKPDQPGAIRAMWRGRRLSVARYLAAELGSPVLEYDWQACRILGLTAGAAGQLQRCQDNAPAVSWSDSDRRFRAKLLEACRLPPDLESHGG